MVKATTVVANPFERSEVHGRNKQNFIGFGIRLRGLGHCLRSSVTSPTTRMKISARASSGMTLGARPPLIVPIFRVLRRADRPPANGCCGCARGVQKLLDGRIAEFRIGGMRHAAARDNFVSERAF